jgi:hypothetical protein
MEPLVLGTLPSVSNNAGAGPTGVLFTSAFHSSLICGSNFPNGVLDDIIIMSELQYPPVLQAPIPAEATTPLTALGALMTVVHTSNPTSHNANPQDNVLALFGTPLQQVSAATTTTTINIHAPSPLDDLENVAGITVDDENAEINLNVDPLVTLKQRFPWLDANL